MNKMLALTVTLVAALATAPAFADPDLANGEKVFKKCAACHAVGPDAKNKIGPMLTGVIGTDIASNPDFKYSDAFLAKKAEGFVWDAASLDEFLKKPKDFISGTKMTFAGLKKDDQRADVIAYIESFKTE